MRISRLPGIHHDSDSILIIDRGDAALINSGTNWYQLLVEERVRGELREHETLNDILLSCRRFNYAGGAAHLSKAFDAKVHIHSEGLNAIELGDHYSTWASRFDSDMPNTAAEPLSAGQKILVGSVEIEGIYLPGHAIDCMGFLISENNILAAGTTIPSAGNPARWDMPTGCLPDLADSIEGLLDLELETVLCGQGSAVKGRERVAGVLERHRDFFDECITEGGDVPKQWDKPAPTANFLTPRPSWDYTHS